MAGKLGIIILFSKFLTKRLPPLHIKDGRSGEKSEIPIILFLKNVMNIILKDN